MSTPNEPDKTPNAGASGPTRGAVVQPWHRGQGESGGSRTQTAPVNGRAGTGNPVAAKPANGNSRDDLQESQRRELPGEELPNLDKIHHVDEAVGTAAGPRTGPVQVGGSGGVRAAVQVRRIDPWATFKVAAVLAVVGFFIWMIAVAVLYLVLGGMGVWDQLNSSFNTLTTDGTSIDSDVIGAGSVFFWSTLIGAISAVLITALTTVGAYIYNICADLVGGVEITIADLD